MDWRATRRRGGRLASGPAASASQKARHLVGDRAMLVAAERRSQRASRWRPRGNGRREKPLLGALLPLQGVLDSRQPKSIALDGMNQRLERRRLRVVVAAADQHTIATG